MVTWREIQLNIIRISIHGVYNYTFSTSGIPTQYQVIHSRIPSIMILLWLIRWLPTSIQLGIHYNYIEYPSHTHVYMILCRIVFKVLLLLLTILLSLQSVPHCSQELQIFLLSTGFEDHHWQTKLWSEIWGIYFMYPLYEGSRHCGMAAVYASV